MHELQGLAEVVQLETGAQDRMLARERVEHRAHRFRLP
jgi:hypothetical protein